MGLQEMWKYPKVINIKTDGKKLYGINSMNSKNRSIILVSVRIQCPICHESYLNKYNLRQHLSGSHTDDEGIKYMKRHKLI